MLCSVVFFFNDTATTEIYTLSLHDALPILPYRQRTEGFHAVRPPGIRIAAGAGIDQEAQPARRRIGRGKGLRSEEHTSELQSRQYLVCRLLLEKKKSAITNPPAFSLRILAP